MAKVIHFKIAALKAVVVLAPSYLAAFLTDKMVWVVPTLAASSFFAATIGLKEESLGRNVDQESTDEVDEGVQEQLDQAADIFDSLEG